MICSRLVRSVGSACVELCIDGKLITLIALQRMIYGAFCSTCVTCATGFSEKRESVCVCWFMYVFASVVVAEDRDRTRDGQLLFIAGRLDAVRSTWYMCRRHVEIRHGMASAHPH